MKQSAIYQGYVRHRRFLPKPHEFKYSLFMLCLDVDNIEQTMSSLPFCSFEKFNWMSFYRKNYLEGDKLNFKQSILQKLAGINFKEEPKIFLLTNLAFFGYCFNPISLYYLYERNTLKAILVEVTNTPWHERHHYVLHEPTFSQPPVYKYTTIKMLHVSPFMTMDFEYQFNFKVSDEQIILHMLNLKNKEKYFDATLNLVGKPLTKENLAIQRRHHPLMTEKIVAMIHWQAAKLWLKGIPFQKHPNKK